MKKLFVCPNKGTRQHMDTAAHCIELLQERLCVLCSLEENTSKMIYGDDRLARFSAQEADMIVAIGGDGAVLRAAQTALEHDKPLLGINTGRLGHLCCLQLQDLENITQDIFASFRACERTLLQFELDQKQYRALNDVIIAKEHFGETLELACKAGETPYGCWRGDGLIIATPTGSTAYNVSAGGPVVAPQVSAFVLTAICPHNEKIPSGVVADDQVICTDILRATDGSACVYADGVFCGKVADTLAVRRSDKTLSLYCR